MSEIRNPKSEIRKKSYARNPKSDLSAATSIGCLRFGFRISDLFRTSDFVFRISALSAVILLAASCGPAAAQGTRADYERAAGLPKLTEGKVLRQRVKPNWLPGNTQFWYRNDLAGGAREFVFVDAEKGERRQAFDHARLATALARAAGGSFAATNLPLEKVEFGADAATLLCTVADKRWQCDLRSYEVKVAAADKAPEASLPAEARPRPSRRTGDETSITFVNRTGAEVKLFWLDEEGQRQAYGSVTPDARRQQHTFAGHVWLVADAKEQPLAVFEATDAGGEAVITGKATATPPESGRRRRNRSTGATSPDGRWQAFVTNQNVFVREVQSGAESPLSTDGQKDDAYAADRFHWSPDSKKLVAIRVKAGDERKVYLIESSPKDQLQPKLHNYNYLKPGDRVPIEEPQLFDLGTKTRVPVSNECFTNPWSIGDLRWTPDSTRFTFLFNQRGHQVLRVVAVDATSGAARPIIEERSKTFIDYSGKFFCHYAERTNEIIWMSERDGWNHLYLYDAATGAVKNQITSGEWVVREVESVDEAARQIWFRAGGVRPGQDPYYVHLCRVNFDGTGLTILTEGDGTHSVEFSPDRKFLLDAWSRVDQPAVTELRRASDGTLACGLERADASALDRTGWRTPERFVAKGRDGTTDIYGIIIRPTNFDPAKKYPVIEEIYAGPQGAFVPKAFGLQMRQHAIAELGFIVVQIDGMGTSQRSKAFHDVAWKNIGDAGFPDRIACLKAAAARYPQMDLTRVGIYGGSAGGQNSTRALLSHGDFYKVAVSDCGCHDNRMDKVWWNEQWMGWPVDESYVRSSNVADAYKLTGKLLLVVGELDRNVDPASTMQVVNALIKADKDFELLVIPGAGHGCAETPYGSRRRMDFFVRHLLGVEPRRS
jgi:dipeptidyl aminopeptidase/acylaminoacyl peptidase